MMQEVTNFGRFYLLFRKLPCVGMDRDELKGELVLRFTGGRTSSLREIRGAEYRELCNALQREVEGEADIVKRMAYMLDLKRHRSVALKLMQRMGIDTTDWQRVNSFCSDARICGKAFRSLDIDELKALASKLRLIERKGGLRGDTSYKLQATSDELRATGDELRATGDELRDTSDEIRATGDELRATGDERSGERMRVSLLIPLGGEKS